MQKMTSRDRKKVVQGLGNFPAQWLTDAERFRTAERMHLRLKDLYREIGTDPAAGQQAWLKLERYLSAYMGQLTAKLRDRVAPVRYRQVKDLMEWVGRPGDLSQDPQCWGFLGGLDALSALYVLMQTARLTHGRADRAMPYLYGLFSTYRALAHSRFEDIRQVCIGMFTEALPNSLFVSITEFDGCPTLEVSYLLADGAGEV